MYGIDDKLLTEIGRKISSMEKNNERKLLLLSNISNRTKINLVLLKYLLQNKKKTGLFITFDRPHQYISKLLKLNNITQENLFYIDAVSLISGESSKHGGINVKFMNGPYQISIFKNLVGRGFGPERKMTPAIDLKDIGFIMIDDISALEVYNDSSAVKEFVCNFYSVVDNLNTFTVSIVLDANYHKELYAIIGEFSDIELTVDPSNLLINEKKVEELSEKSVGEIISTTPTIRKRRVRNRAKGVIV